jgi:hypothetical protein
MGVSPFNTPLYAAIELVDKLPIRSGQVIWEPHAGSGAFVQAILFRARREGLKLDLCISDIDPDVPALSPGFLLNVGTADGLVCIHARVHDFMAPFPWGGVRFDWIIGNPPYNLPPPPGGKRGKSIVEDHILRAIEVVGHGGIGGNVAYLLKNSVLEGSKRHEAIWSLHPTRHVWLLARRISFLDYQGRKMGDGGDKYGYGFFWWDIGQNLNEPYRHYSTFEVIDLKGPP